MFGTALIVPIHNLHWGWGCSFCTFIPKVLFPDYLERGMADTKLHPFLVSIPLIAMSLWSCIGKKNVADEVLKNCK